MHVRQSDGEHGKVRFPLFGRVDEQGEQRILFRLARKVGKLREGHRAAAAELDGKALCALIQRKGAVCDRCRTIPLQNIDGPQHAEIFLPFGDGMPVEIGAVYDAPFARGVRRELLSREHAAVRRGDAHLRLLLFAPVGERALRFHDLPEEDLLRGGCGVSPLRRKDGGKRKAQRRTEQKQQNDKAAAPPFPKFHHLIPPYFSVYALMPPTVRLVISRLWKATNTTMMGSATMSMYAILVGTSDVGR